MATRTNLAKIHIAKKELNLSDDIYRDILAVQFNAGSSKDLTDLQCIKLLQHFEKLGWSQKIAARGKALVPETRTTAQRQGDDPQAKKIMALWGALHRSGKVKYNSDKALSGYVKRMTGKDSLKWCTSAEKRTIIEALNKWDAREVKNAP